METQAIQEEVQLEEKESAGSSRRGFLRQAAAAGAGSAALALLVGAAGSQRAEADTPLKIGLALDFFDIEVKGGNVTVATLVPPIVIYPPAKVNVNNVSIFYVPVRKDVSSTVYGGWWAPDSNLQNLTQFNYLEAYIDSAMWIISVRPASGITDTGLSIATYALHST